MASKRIGNSENVNTKKTSTGKSPLVFFLLVFALTVPFWVLSTIVKHEGLPDNLPVTDIGATFVPLLAAAILVFREEGFDGVKRLLARMFDFTKIKQRRWYFPIVLLMPVLYLLTYAVMRLAGLHIPTEWSIPPLAPIIFLAFFVAAAGEELGYMGHAIDPMQERWSALTAALIMGAVHALWHYPSMIELGQTPGLMAWGTLYTIAFRVLVVWLYNNTGSSVFAAILFHAIANTGRSIFPGGRSSFEVGDAAVGYSIIIITAIVITFLWGSKTLARYRYA